METRERRGSNNYSPMKALDSKPDVCSNEGVRVRRGKTPQRLQTRPKEGREGAEEPRESARYVWVANQKRGPKESHSRKTQTQQQLSRAFFFSVKRIFASDSLCARMDPNSAAVRLPMLNPAPRLSGRALILVAEPLQVVMAAVVLVLVVRARVARYRGGVSFGKFGW